MAATTTNLMTVEEFRKLPEDTGPVYHELRNGEVVVVARPKLRHHFILQWLRRFMESIAPRGGILDSELAFRALPEYELREAMLDMSARSGRRRWTLTTTCAGRPICFLHPTRFRKSTKKSSFAWKTGARDSGISSCR